jgi:HK97 family phage major capsid protein
MSLLRSKQLRAERRTLSTQMQAIVSRAETDGNRSFTTEERDEFDRLHTRQEELRGDIERIEAHEDLQAQLGESQGTAAGRQDSEGRSGPSDDHAENEALEARAFSGYIRHGIAGLRAEERSVLQSRMTDLTPEQRAFAAGTGNVGGVTVPQGFYARIVEAMARYGGMRASRAFQFSTGSGAALPVPTVNDSAVEGELIGENAAHTVDSSTPFSSATLNSYLYGSKIVPVSIQLLQDSYFDIDTFLTNLLGKRLGRITNRHYTVGTGSGQPQGVVVGSTLGKTGTTGQTLSIITDDLYDLKHAVDPEYRTDAQWMFHDTTLKVIKKLKDSQNRPLWTSGLAVREPDTIDGDPYVVNQHMAVMAANAKSVLYGDFSNYFIRDVLGIQILRLSERYADFLQVGFLAFLRTDGKLVDAGTNPIKYYANSAT